MTTVVCDKCGSETRPKKITSKKTGKDYTVYECLGECMNGQYKYSCFAPKVQKQEAPSANNHVITLLEEVKAICLAMNAKLGAVPKVPKKKLPVVDVDEDGFPAPTDEDAPF
jgi:hypothetical protein